ncbi:hypothetical protein BDN71DRAFT_1483548 [Pleurotus eryngii]|uniref:peptidylprolyl isomerase n=1 Tax=Pleurotus eryngii TaxID=5323 RepID=A0A9P6DF32_PLEER|nr:hypothetical protein BDN71DRAFT_1483548 [Pleurotus eryngii]
MSSRPRPPPVPSQNATSKEISQYDLHRMIKHLKGHLGKRPRSDNEPTVIANPAQVDVEESDDEDVGPMPMTGVEVQKKRKKGAKWSVLPHERLFLEHLPSADQYYRSFMHRDVINFCVMTKTDFFITSCADGHVKLWKKQDTGIEFVKHYRTHLRPVTAVSASADGQIFASISEDGTAKVFDVINFDMITIIELGFTPSTCCWVHSRGQAQALLAVTDSASGSIKIYDARGNDTPLMSVDDLHRFPVTVMAYSDRYDTVISADNQGFLEYWQPREPLGCQRMFRDWQFKSQTDLYDFKKAKSTPTCITLSPDSLSFVTFSLPDRQIRIFSFLTGKLSRKYDESLTAIQEMQQAGTAVYRVEDMEFGRRLAVEKELDLPGPVGHVPGTCINAIWHESGSFVLYPSLLGIKVVNAVTNWVGAPAKRTITTMAMAASANPILADRTARDSHLFCTTYKRQRFYLFTRSEPEDTKSGDRDVFNERLTREEQSIASTTTTSTNKGPSPVADTATIHTTVGDIHLRLFPAQAPKAVENFVGHARSSYFEGVIFHRVIPKFMIQTGDPPGDGTGGTSIWGREFEDEFSDDPMHDRPYTVSMANAGPGTNGSQFFITTTATPWLDKKHTIFGRVISGSEVVHTIENVKTNKTDKPYDDIKIINVDVK